MGRIALYIRAGQAVASPIVMAPVAEGLRYDPALTLEPEQAQALMDELWRTGLRPTERHLADMRALVFKTGKP